MKTRPLMRAYPSIVPEYFAMLLRSVSSYTGYTSNVRAVKDQRGYHSWSRFIILLPNNMLLSSAEGKI